MVIPLLAINARTTFNKICNTYNTVLSSILINELQYHKYNKQYYMTYLQNTQHNTTHIEYKVVFSSGVIVIGHVIVMMTSCDITDITIVTDE